MADVVSNRSQRASSMSKKLGARSLDVTSKVLSPRNNTTERQPEPKPVHAANATIQQSSRSVSVFDPTTHKPPNIDQFGYNQETHHKVRDLLNRNAKNVLTQAVRVPTWWHSKNNRSSALPSSPDVLPATDGDAEVQRHLRSQSINALPEKMTFTKLKDIRRKEILPDISYDLDGDGFVGGRDYVVARRFDKGHKNYLTAEERAEVTQALKDGYESKFVWNVEAAGAQRPYRIMQKRGVFVDGDDFLGVTSTYPKHPMSDLIPNCSTNTELIEKRKTHDREDIRFKKTAMDNKFAGLQSVGYKSYYAPQEYVENPKYTASWQRIEEERKKKRERGGLSDTGIDINPEKLPDPTIKWVDKPGVYAQSLLFQKRKTDNLDDQQKFEKNFETHVDGQGRIEERENCIARLAFKKQDVVTMNKQILKERRTKEMIEDMTAKFGQQVLGVHGAELPKFAGHPTDQFYWTMQQTYNKNPRCQSLNQYQQNVKFWANNDNMKLADTAAGLGPQDTFKTEYHPKRSKYHITNKANLENHWKFNDIIGDPEFKRKWEPMKRWSQVEKELRCEGGDRDYRTVKKIYEAEKAKEVEDIEREKLMEEVVIRQAPRSLQQEVSQMIQAEKMIEASMQIGKGTRAAASQNDGSGQTQEQQPARMTKDTSASGTVKNDNKTSQQHITDNDANAQKRVDNNTLFASMFMTNPGKGSLMQRMANPNTQTEKKVGPGSNFGNTLMTTMANTGKNAGDVSMNSSQGSMMHTQRFQATHHSSPFRESIVRGMVTGVGLLGTSK